MFLAMALSTLVGLSLGLLGGGGSILTVPILVYVVGLEAKAAIASSLLIVGVTSAAAMLVHARAGRVRWKTGFSFGAASMTGAYVGGRLAHWVAGGVLLGAFTVVMVVTAVMMMRKRGEQKAVVPSAGRTLAIGLGAGALTGLVGAGGGFIVVPALAMLGGLPIAEAVATSLLVIALNSFAGLAGTIGSVPLDFAMALQLTAAAVAGSFGGVMLSKRVKPEQLRKGFAWFVLGMAGLMTYKQFHFAGLAVLTLAAMVLMLVLIVRRAARDHAGAATK